MQQSTFTVRMQKSPSIANLKAGVAISVMLACAGMARAQNTYSGYSSGNLAAPTAPNFWSGGTPVPSSSLDIRLLAVANNFGISATNDLGTLTLNTLRFANFGTSTFTINSNSPNIFAFDGTSPRIIQEGYGNVSFSPSNLSSTTGAISIRGGGHGDLSFNGVTTASNINIDGASGLLNSQIISIGGSTLNLGPIVLNSGNLRLGFSSVGFGAGIPSPITINGGAFNVNSAGSAATAVLGDKNFTLNATLLQTGGSTTNAGIGQNIAYTGILSGNGGYTLSPTLGGSQTNFRNAMTYTGDTTIRFAPVYGAAGGSGAVAFNANLIIDAANASNAAITGTANINLRDGGTLQIVNGSAAPIDRVNNAAPINLNGGNLTLSSVTTTTANSYNESFGALNAAAGTGTITLTNTATASATNFNTLTATFASLSRAAGEGALFIRGTNLGQAARNTLATTQVMFTSASSNIVYSGAPSGTVGVLPFVLGATSATETGSTQTNTSSAIFGLTTYDNTNGVRLLSLAEYTTLTTGTLPASAGNVRLNATGATSFALPTGSDVTLNSLFINPASGATTIAAGSGGEKLAFPADSANLIVINQSQSNTIAAPISFGAEGRIFAMNNGSQTSGPNLNGIISGSNGLTIAGPGGVNLNAANTVSGTLALDGAGVAIPDASAIANITTIKASGAAGVGTSQPTATQTRPRFQFNPAASNSTLTLSQNITLDSGLLELQNNSLSTSNGGLIDLQGKLTGSGGLYINTGNGSLTMSVRLSNINNDYTGQTRVFNGFLELADDRVLGNGGVLDLAGSSTGGVRLLGNWNSSRQINVSSSSTINTNGFNATLSGPISSTGAATSDILVKSGNGTLNLTGNNPLGMVVSVTGGTLRVNGTIGFNASVGNISVSSGATLGGTGTIYRGVTINSLGILAPGNSIGTLTVGGSVSLATATAPNYSQLQIETFGNGINAPTNDTLALIGTGVNFSTNSNVLNVIDTSGQGYSYGDVLWIVDNQSPVSGTGAGSIFGTFRPDAASALVSDDGQFVTFGGWTWFISYNANRDINNPNLVNANYGLAAGIAGNDIALVAIPAPGAGALVGLGGLAAMARRRRRN